MLAKNKEHSARSKGDRRLCFERAERLAKQDARARTRSSSGALACECAEQLIESRELSTAARRSRGYRGMPPVLLFFCRRFLFQIKRKCRNAGSIYCLIMVCSEGRNQLATIQPYYNFVSASPISDSRKGCPYEVRGLKFVRILKGERSSPLRSAKRAFPKISCRSRGSGALSRRTLQATYQ